MGMFSPEFSAFWLGLGGLSADLRQEWRVVASAAHPMLLGFDGVASVASRIPGSSVQVI